MREDDCAVDDDGLTCPRCGHRLKPAGTVLHPFWDCVSCGFYTADALLGR
jgi:hypothetical protein